MRIVQALYVASAAAGMLLARQASAQDSRVVVHRLHKAGDTLAVRNAQVTVDHTIEAGITDSAGIVRIPDLDDGGHIVEAVARGYQTFFDKFTSGPNVPQPIQLELLPLAPTEKVKGQPTGLRVAGFDGRRAGGQGKFFTRAQLTAASGRPLSNLLKLDAGAFISSGTARRVPAGVGCTTASTRTVLCRCGPRRGPSLSVRGRRPTRSRQDFRRGPRGC